MQIQRKRLTSTSSQKQNKKVPIEVSIMRKKKKNKERDKWVKMIGLINFFAKISFKVNLKSIANNMQKMVSI